MAHEDDFESPVARGAQRVAHASDRLHRRLHRRGRHPMFGVVLIGLGTLFLLDNLDIIEARFVFRNLWPLAMVAWGGYHVVNGPHTTSRIIGACVMALGGLLLGDRLFGWQIDAWDLFWPVLLILFGIHVFFNSRRLEARDWRAPAVPPIPDIEAEPRRPMADDTTVPPADGRVDTSSTFKEVAILAGIERRNLSQTFRGGEATAIMGGVEIDLRECRMSSGDAFVDVLAIMGGVELRIPKEWTVESQVTALLAGLEDRSVPPVTPDAPRLIVRGTVLLGGVEIRN